MAKTITRKAASKISAPPVSRAEPEGEHVDLATPSEEADMRKSATSPAARKAALAAGKKDPLEKWGPDNPDAERADQRRANFG